MIRLLRRGPTGQSHELAFADGPVTIGRSPDNHIHLDDPRISKHHGRFFVSDGAVYYEDLNSTNGSIALQRGRSVRLQAARGITTLEVSAGDIISLASDTLQLLALPAPPARASSSRTVIASKTDLDLSQVESEVITSDPARARRFFQFVRNTHVASTDEALLKRAIIDFAFETFPDATHIVTVLRENRTEHLRTFIAAARSGEKGNVVPSRTMITKVLGEGVPILFSHLEAGRTATESIAEMRIRTALCAPLSTQKQPFGAIQLDSRGDKSEDFTPADLDLLVVFAGHVALVLENLRLYQEQREALESTINALVQSFSWNDPETVAHSERVRYVSLEIGRLLGLPETDLEVLGVAAILHDLGKQAVRDEILLKRGRLTPQEREEVDRHVSYTRELLEKIRYPEHLLPVPRIAAYHHEKMDGSGPFGIRGDAIPIQSRIIAVADAFDALLSQRSYKESKPLSDVLQILDDGRDTQWDGRVIDALKELALGLVWSYYTRGEDAARGVGSGKAARDDLERAA
jgi:HD-GYP domain-containing protein (c-di-GMP phosphodiesterase class II)